MFSVCVVVPKIAQSLTIEYCVSVLILYCKNKDVSVVLVPHTGGAGRSPARGVTFSVIEYVVF